MATATLNLPVTTARLSDGSTSNAAPQYSLRKGSETAPAKHITTLDFDASTQENVTYQFTMPQNYASAPVLRLQWMANATAGSCVWACKLGAVTSGDADTPVEHALATAQSATTATNATEARRLNETTITITNTDSVAAGDLVFLLVYRDAANGSDTLSVDAELIHASLDYVTT